MARVILGIGCAHTPQLHTAADQWEIRARRDAADGVPLWYKGQRMPYADVLDQRTHLNLQIDMSTREKRLKASFAALAKLGDIFAAAAPDVTVVFGNDQAEMFLDDLKPAFTIMGSPEFRNVPRTAAQKSRLPPGIALSDSGHLPDSGATVYPGHPELALHLAQYAVKNEFDVAWSNRQFLPEPERSQTSGMPHAYGFIYKQIFRGQPVRNIPIDSNTVYAPNQPVAARCLAFGRMIGDALRAWEDDLRVCVVASGGLSHFVVDEEFDRDIMCAMEKNDFEHLLSYSEGYYQAGSSEIKSWIAAGGAMQGSGLKGQVVDYQALYRTPAGTGSSAAFMVWQ
ncbi:MAG: protocatechuate 3,4-dioxygenase [Woeseiaceae bacterium]